MGPQVLIDILAPLISLRPAGSGACLGVQRYTGTQAIDEWRKPVDILSERHFGTRFERKREARKRFYSQF